MLSSNLVREVSRAGEPATVAGFTLTIEYLIRNTTGGDWEGCYVILKQTAAATIATKLNQAEPWRNAERIRAVAGRRRPRALKGSQVIEGQVVA